MTQMGSLVAGWAAFFLYFDIVEEKVFREVRRRPQAADAARAAPRFLRLCSGHCSCKTHFARLWLVSRLNWNSLSEIPWSGASLLYRL